MDNLQSVTYQTFEQDPVKYQKYEEVRSAFYDPSFHLVETVIFSEPSTGRLRSSRRLARSRQNVGRY